MQDESRLLVVVEVIQGLIALALVGVLGGIAVAEALNGKPFEEPTTIAVLAGAAVAWYFRGAAGTQQRVQTMQTVDRLMAGGQTHVIAPPGTAEIKVSPAEGNGGPTGVSAMHPPEPGP